VPAELISTRAGRASRSCSSACRAIPNRGSGRCSPTAASPWRRVLCRWPPDLTQRRTTAAAAVSSEPCGADRAPSSVSAQPYPVSSPGLPRASSTMLARRLVSAPAPTRARRARTSEPPGLPADSAREGGHVDSSSVRSEQYGCDDIRRSPWRAPSRAGAHPARRIRASRARPQRGVTTRARGGDRHEPRPRRRPQQLVAGV